MLKKTFKIIGMHCTSCALVIESDLTDAGITATCHYAKGLCSVEYDEQKVTEEQIRSIVRQSGYELQTP